MRLIITLAAVVLTMMSVQASVVINSTNFPDPQLLENAQWYDEDGNGVLSDDELQTATSISLHWGLTSLKGLEHFKYLKNFNLWYHDYPEEEVEANEEQLAYLITSYDFSVLPNLEYLSLQSCYGFTSLDLSKNTKLKEIQLEHCLHISSVKLPVGIEVIHFLRMPKLTAFDFKQFKGLAYLWLMDTGISDVDLSNMASLRSVSVRSFDVESSGFYPLNTFDVSGCTALERVEIDAATIKKAAFKGHPELGSIDITNSTLTDISIENCGIRGITVFDNRIDHLTIKDCPEMNEALDCHNNELKVLMLDNLPLLANVDCRDNHLMFLDLSGMKNEYEEATAYFNGDNQTPTAVAYKLSPTEVGLRTHNRMDPARMLNLMTNGKRVTATETTIDGIRYIVFSNDGANAESLKGKTSTYEYETKWPYAWQDGNSKDNNLPVALYVSGVTKHPASLTVAPTSITGEYGLPAPAMPTVTRSQNYDGQLTFTSSNESVVKVDALTGELTPAGPGTATITVSGAETDYRQAPPSVSFTAYINVRKGDVNTDGTVDVADIATIISVMADGSQAPSADVNSDGVADVADIATVISIMAASSRKERSLDRYM